MSSRRITAVTRIVGDPAAVGLNVAFCRRSALVQSPLIVIVPLWTSGRESRRNLTRVRWSGASASSHASPTPSPSRSAWSGLATVGQLSSAAQRPSPSASPPPPATQAPPWQESGTLQTSPSSHIVPSATGAGTHVPGSSHTPVLHWSATLEQSIGVPATQRPVAPSQVSTPLQARPSLQPVSSVSVG